LGGDVVAVTGSVEGIVVDKDVGVVRPLVPDLVDERGLTVDATESADSLAAPEVGVECPEASVLSSFPFFLFLNFFKESKTLDVVDFLIVNDIIFSWYEAGINDSTYAFIGLSTANSSSSSRDDNSSNGEMPSALLLLLLVFASFSVLLHRLERNIFVALPCACCR
jgi:hypothetical protein